jgi:hypothetical protein
MWAEAGQQRAERAESDGRRPSEARAGGPAGWRVEFEIGQGRKGEEAQNVRVI